jgi:hypothetical protein
MGRAARLYVRTKDFDSAVSWGRRRRRRRRSRRRGRRRRRRRRTRAAPQIGCLRREVAWRQEAAAHQSAGQAVMGIMLCELKRGDVVAAEKVLPA